MTQSQIVKLIAATIGGIICLSLLISSVEIIRAGERGIVLELGAVQDEILGEGLHFVNPFTENVKVLNVQVQKEEKKSTAASKDLQIVTAQVAINYRLGADSVHLIWQEIGRDYSQKVIAPAIEEYIKKTTAKFTAEELVTKREEVKDTLKVAITENLAQNYIIVEDIFITDFAFSAEFDKAIESKVTAEQRALESKNKLEQVKYEAEQQLEKARAEAESIRIQAQAVTQQGGKDYVQLKAIEKWNGVLPGQMIPGGTVPFLELNK